MVDTARVQYVFLDVVGFTRNRSVEAQSEVVAKLNEIVVLTLQGLNIPIDQTVLIPTGDGIAIALIGLTGFDIHLQIALEILSLISKHNSATTDKMRRFEVRIGINENIDNILTDINGKRNVAGAGISMAQSLNLWRRTAVWSIKVFLLLTPPVVEKATFLLETRPYMLQQHPQRL